MSRSSLLGHLLTALFTLALLVGVAALGQVPFGSPSGKAILRVSLRTVHAKAEICRDLTEAELEALPQHMRQPRACEEIAPEYRLTVSIDGRQVFDDRIAPGGLRGDRPLIVDRQMSLDPGAVRLEVDFEPVVDEAIRKSLIEASVELPSYRFDGEVELTADRVALITTTGARQIGLYVDDRPAG